MSFESRIVSFLERRCEKKLIGDACHPDLGPLLTRYFLLKTGPVTIMAHRFQRSDNDRHFHDHPWAFFTFLLGPYTEHTPHGVFNHKRFTLLFRPATWFHWVEIHEPVWSIVIRFRRVRMWGFITERGWQDWKTYGKEWCD